MNLGFMVKNNALYVMFNISFLWFIVLFVKINICDALFNVFNIYYVYFMFSIYCVRFHAFHVLKNIVSVLYS